jgi:hypothetical protein
MKTVGALSGAVVVFLLAVATPGCAGAGVQVTAARSLYPISMSGDVRDSTGTLLDARSLTRVGDLQTGRTRVGFLYSGLTPLSTFDISDDVNAQVAAVQGEAVVHLAVTVTGDCDFLNSLLVFNILPIWPGCVPVTINGVIVRRRPPPPGP